MPERTAGWRWSSKAASIFELYGRRVWRLVTTSVGRLFLGVGMGLVLSATNLAAQTLPLPTLPIELAPEAESPPSTATPGATTPTEVSQTPAIEIQEPAQAPAWDYMVGLGLSWHSNIDFKVPDGPSGLAVVPRTRLAHVSRVPRGELRAEATASCVGYVEQNDLSRANLRLSLDGNYRSSPGTKWHGGASYAFAHTDSAPILQDQGVLLRLARVRMLAGNVGLSLQLRTRTLLSINARVYRADFDDPLFLDGQSMRATIGLERRLTFRSRAAVHYALENALSAHTDRYYVTHFGSVQWTWLFSRRSGLLLEMGGSHTPDPARAGLKRGADFYGGASYRREVGRSNLTAFLRREVVPTFGLGGSLSAIRAGLRARVPIARVWEVQFAASHTRPDAWQEPGWAFPSADDVSMSVCRRLGRSVEISGEAAYRRRGATESTPGLEAFQASLFVAVGS